MRCEAPKCWLMQKILFLFSFLFALNLLAQQDLKWLKIKKYKVATLSDSLKETSGLTFFRDKLYTINDGGNTSEIFEIDKKSGKILNKIKTEFKNFDWESITSDSANIFIGDTGNNWGIRKDLKIYKITLDSVVSAPSANNALNFQYPEQTTFQKLPQSNDWDSESLIFVNGKLHLVTKEWKSMKTAHYELPTEVSERILPAKKTEEFDLNFLATDAAYFQNKLYIIGYTKKMEVYLSVFAEQNGLFFNKKPQKYYLGSTSSIGQVEGIAVNADGIFISAEAFNLKIFQAKQALYFIPWKGFGK